MKKLHLIAMTILLAVGCAMLPSPIEAAGNNPGPPIVGLWLRIATDPNNNDVIVSRGFQEYHIDRTEILIDDRPPTAGNHCVGTWIQAGARTYKLEHVAWTFDAGGAVNGTLRLRETVTVDPSGESFEGTNEFVSCDLNLENCVDLGDFDVHGTRLHVNF